VPRRTETKRVSAALAERTGFDRLYSYIKQYMDYSYFITLRNAANTSFITTENSVVC